MRHTFWLVAVALVASWIAYRRLAPPPTPQPLPNRHADTNEPKGRAKSTSNPEGAEPEDGEFTTMHLTPFAGYPALAEMSGPWEIEGPAAADALPSRDLGVVVRIEGQPRVVRVAGVTLQGVDDPTGQAREFVAQFCRECRRVWLYRESTLERPGQPFSAYICAPDSTSREIGAPYSVLSEQLVGRGLVLVDRDLDSRSRFSPTLHQLEHLAAADKIGRWTKGEMHPPVGDGVQTAPK